MIKMNRFVFALLCITVMLPTIGHSAWSEKKRAFAVLPSSAGSLCTENFFQSVRDLESIGANLVTIRVPKVVGSLQSSVISSYFRTPSDSALRCGIEFIRSRGLQFSIHVIVNVPNSQWRANLDPTNRDNFFREMGIFATKYARDFAQPLGAAHFSIGTEMYKTVSNVYNSYNAAAPGRYRWPEIIRDVRASYSGPITYSAQHSGNRSAVFEDNDLMANLDFLSFSAYWPLNASDKPGLLREWERVERQTILPAFNRYGKQIAIAEAGYRPCSFTFVRPYDSGTACAYNGAAQAIAWDALLTFFANKSYFDGLIGGWFWKDDPNQGGAGDTDYTPWRKPAASIFVDQWVTSGGTPPPPPPPTDECNLASNGSLNNNTSGWSNSGSPSIVSDAVSGGGAMRVAGGFTSTIVRVSPNTRYAITGYVKSSAGNGWSGLGVDYLNSSGNEIGEDVRTVRPTSYYNLFSINNVTPAGTQFARFWLFAADSRSIQLDEFDLRLNGCAGSNPANQPPEISSPGNQVNSVGSTINLAINASDAEGRSMQFAAENLPAGLQINGATGRITGRANSVINTRVTVTVSDGVSRRNTSFNWTIQSEGMPVAQCNLLDNGNFESNANGWFTNTSLQLTSDASSGQQAVRYTGGSISATLEAQAGSSFNFTGRYKSTSGSAWSGYGIDYLNSSRQEIADEVRVLTPTGSYSDISFSGTVPGGASYIRVWLFSPNGRTLTLDNLQLRDASCGV